MEQEIRKKRQVNFELLRILCMYMIVIGHGHETGSAR